MLLLILILIIVIVLGPESNQIDSLPLSLIPRKSEAGDRSIDGKESSEEEMATCTFFKEMGRGRETNDHFRKLI